MKSVFSPFVGGVKTREQYEEKAKSSENDKPFTPADTLTVARPALALKAASMLLVGKQPVTPWVIAMAASDMEGIPARAIQKRWPDSGLGTTAHGARWDTYADTSALVIVGTASMFAPRVTMGGKAAIGLVLGEEVVKARWAWKGNRQFLHAVNEHRSALEIAAGEQTDLDDYKTISAKIGSLPTRLEIPASARGKAAMADKLAGVTLAISTNDFNDRNTRAELTAASLYFAGNGTWEGEASRRSYGTMLEGMIDEHRVAAQSLVERL